MNCSMRTTRHNAPYLFSSSLSGLGDIKQDDNQQLHWRQLYYSVGSRYLRENGLIATLGTPRINSYTYTMVENEMVDGRDASRSNSDATPSTIAPTHVLHLLIPCDDGDHVLAEIGPENAARLPRVRIPTSGNKYYSWDVLEEKVEERFLFPVCLVKNTYAYEEDDIENPGCNVLQDMWTVHPKCELPPMAEPLRWVHEDDVSSYNWPNAIRSFVAGHVHQEIEDMFRDLNMGFEMRAKPWEALGFYKTLTSWCHRALRRRNMIIQGRIRTLQDRVESKLFTCVARVQNDEKANSVTGREEVVFIKCTIPGAREVERTVAVASVFGVIVPEILGFDTQRGVLMQRNAGKVAKEELDRETLIDTVLRMQRVSLNHIAELEAKGVPVMDTEWLESRVEPILNHVIFEEFFAFLEESKSPCDDERETIKGLRSKTDELRRMCRQISKLGLPNTIVHGDCYAGNIGSLTRTRDGKMYRFFDWATCHIGNPLVDLERILPRVSTLVMSPEEWKAGVRQVSVEWKQLAGLKYAETRKALDDMGYLYLLHCAYRLEEQFDVCMARAKEDDDFELELKAHQVRIFVSLEDVILNLNMINEYIEPRKRGDT